MFKLYPSWFVFFLVVLLGIFFVLGSDNWFIIWIGFEFSLLGFLPILSGTIVVTEGLVKYFLIQAGGSSLFIFSVLFNFPFLGGFLFLLSMSIKLGLFPFFQWVPLIMSSLSWFGCFFLSTFQKVAPVFSLLLQANSGGFYVLFLGSVSVLVSGIFGFNQSFMRPLMGYSSVSHTGWLVCGGFFSFSLVIFYFLFYSFFLFFLFSLFDRLNVSSTVFGGFSFSSFFVCSFILVCLSGVPPFFIFFFKILVFYFLSFSYVLCSFLVLGSVLSIYYYLSIIIPNSLGYGYFYSISSGFLFFMFVFFLCLLFLFLI